MAASRRFTPTPRRGTSRRGKESMAQILKRVVRWVLEWLLKKI